MRILVIPEDPTDDQYILKPIVEKLMEDIGRPAKVEVLRDPKMRGADEALNAEVVAAIIEDNQAMIDLFLLMIDRDCNRQSHETRLAARVGEHPHVLLGCAAVEEVETWMLALHRGELKVSFGDVRAECDPKERFAEPFLAGKGWTTEVWRWSQARNESARRPVDRSAPGLSGRGRTARPSSGLARRAAGLRPGLSSASTPGCPWPARRRTRR